MTTSRPYPPPQLAQGPVEWGKVIVLAPTVALIGGRVDVALGQALVVGEFDFTVVSNQSLVIRGVELSSGLRKWRGIDRQTADGAQTITTYKCTVLDWSRELVAFPSGPFVSFWPIPQSAGTTQIWVSLLDLNERYVPTASWRAKHHLISTTTNIVEVTQ